MLHVKTHYGLSDSVICYPKCNYFSSIPKCGYFIGTYDWPWFPMDLHCDVLTSLAQVMAHEAKNDVMVINSIRQNTSLGCLKTLAKARQ